MPESQDALKVTDKAAAQIAELAAGRLGKGLRIFVEAGGCSGLQYGMSLDDKKTDDTIIEHLGAMVLLDPSSQVYLHGSTIDYSDGLTGAGFRIHNPNARQTCGCGTSFEA